MKLHDLPRQSQSQADAGAVRALRDPVKGIENVGQLIGRQARPVSER